MVTGLSNDIEHICIEEKLPILEPIKSIADYDMFYLNENYFLITRFVKKVFHAPYNNFDCVISLWMGEEEKIDDMPMSPFHHDWLLCDGFTMPFKIENNETVPDWKLYDIRVTEYLRNMIVI